MNSADNDNDDVIRTQDPQRRKIYAEFVLTTIIQNHTIAKVQELFVQKYCSFF
jgi:hypothetical protein